MKEKDKANTHKKSPVKIILTVLAVIVSLILVLFATAYFYTKAQIKPLAASVSADSEIVQKTRIEISMGTSVYRISEILEENSIIKNAKFFYYFVHYPFLFDFFFPQQAGQSQIELKSGIYYLTPSMNYAEIIETLSSGRQEYIKIVIPEGLTISKIGELLEENGICTKNDFRKS